MKRLSAVPTLPGARTMIASSLAVTLNTAIAASPDATTSASAPASSPIPFKPTSSSDAANIGDGWWVVVIGLVVLVAASLWLRRRVGALPRLAQRTRAISVLESARLGERMRLTVVHYKGREMLIAHGDQSVTVLADDRIDPAMEHRP